MKRRSLPGGLRTQLALAISVVTALAVGASFLALLSGTGARLRAQIDTGLKLQLAEWQQFVTGHDLNASPALERIATRFIAAQRYHADGLVIVVQLADGATVTNNDGLLASELARERELHAAQTTLLLRAPAGFSEASVAEAGQMRVLSRPLDFGHRRMGTLRFASPLQPVLRAQASLKRAFLVIGLLAVALAIAAGIGLAALIGAPLRRITRVASAVGDGDFSIRAGPTASGGEVAVLAGAFDEMLNRLERLFASQRDFVSDASHELRTPLSVLRAQTELLERESDEQRRSQGLATLVHKIDELDRLVGDMLTLAAAEGGQLVQPRQTDLTDFFEDVRRDLPLFGERDFRLTTVDGTVLADPDRLTQVLRNLIRNAVTHTERHDRVEVVASASDHTLEIVVRDSGSGIPADQLEQIFDRFHRVAGDGSSDQTGTGLGLAIARAIIEAHGGTIRAESPPGGGASFRIELPGYLPRNEALIYA